MTRTSPRFRLITIAPAALAASISLSSLAACGAAAGTTEDTGASLQPLTDPPSPTACASDAECAADELCATEAVTDECGGTGVCTSRGEGTYCPYIDLSLCGCDGNVYANSCTAHRAGMSVDPHPFRNGNVTARELEKRPFTDASETYFYTFERFGRFEEHTEPPCTRSEPHCDIVAVPLAGTFTKHDGTVDLTYDDGNTATFTAEESCTGAWHLIGFDFGSALTLAITSIDP